MRLFFHYDFVCPYAYLASLEVERVARAAETTLVWKPMLLGGVFRAIGAPDTPSMNPARARYNDMDLARQALRAGVTLVRPAHHPRRTVLALRAAVAAGDALPKASRALFDAYWARGEDLEDPSVVRAALERAGISDAAGIVERASGSEAKEALRKLTDEAVSRGIFGAPAFVVERGNGSDELFWGNDRLDFVRAALGSPPAVRRRTSPTPARTAELYFDFSSPFAYLGVRRAQRIAARTGASIVYRPLLLGALFKAVGAPNVPLFDMPPSKQRHVGVDLERWAKAWDVPLRFASRFPINSVKALRVVLAVPEARREDVIDRIFTAAWAEDRDVTNDDVLADILRTAGCDEAAVLEAITTPAIKDALKAATSEAEKRGVFGVPTVFVGDERFWGQDGFGWVEALLEA